MDRSIFFQHYRLCLDGKLTGIPCVNEDHPIMHPFVDLDTGKARYECLNCDYKIVPGITMWNNLYAEVRAATDDP